LSDDVMVKRVGERGALEIEKETRAKVSYKESKR